TEISPLSLHDALPIWAGSAVCRSRSVTTSGSAAASSSAPASRSETTPSSAPAALSPATYLPAWSPSAFRPSSTARSPDRLRNRDPRELRRVDHEVERSDAAVRNGDADHGERTAGATDDGPPRAVARRRPGERGHRGPAARVGDDPSSTDDRRMCERAPGTAIDAQGDLRVEQLEQRVEVSLTRSSQKRIDEPLLLRQLDVRLEARTLDAAARPARELARSVGATPDNRRDLVERHREHVVQNEREPLGRRKRLEHDVEREPDAVRDQRFVLRGRAVVDRDDRLRHPGADVLLAA